MPRRPRFAARRLVLSFALALVLPAALTSVARAAVPAGLLLDPAGPFGIVTGKTYTASLSPALCLPQSLDPLDLTCDHFTLQAGVPPSHWNEHEGELLITIDWPAADDDFDLFVYAGGVEVGRSTLRRTTSEAVVIQNPSGSYESRVVPVGVTNSGYSGMGEFGSQPIDRRPPTAPTNLTVTGTTQTSISLSWSAAGDNRAVAGYGLYRDGTSVGSTSSTSATFTGLTCATTYTLGVDAYDAAGNRSGIATRSASTSSCSDPPPPPPPPPPPGGTVIHTTQPWNCTRPLSSYGPLPIRLVQEIDNASSAGQSDGIGLEGGCAGDGNPNTIDLVIDQRGNGGSLGPGGDAVKLRRGPTGQGPQNIDVTGSINCGGWRVGHQDGVHAMTGRGIRFVNLVSGNPSTRQGTCWGAGGLFFVAQGGSQFAVPTDIVCSGCRLVSASPDRGDGPGGRGMLVANSVRSGAVDTCVYNARHGIEFQSSNVDPVNVNNHWVRYPADADRC